MVCFVNVVHTKECHKQAVYMRFISLLQYGTDHGRRKLYE